MAKTNGGEPDGNRKLKLRVRRLSKAQLKKQAKSKRLPRAWRIMWASVKTFRYNWRLIGGITFVYGILSALLVQSSVSLNNFQLEEAGAFEEATTEFDSLLNSFGASDSLMQLLLLLLFGLALIWALRRINGGDSTSTKQAYYQAMTPLVPVIILLILFFIQLVPMLLTSAGLQFALGSGISGSPIEAVLWLALFVLATIWTFFMISRTFVAIFIVTLPGLTPLEARRKAKELVTGRRLPISLKLIFLPLVMFLALMLLLIPVIMFLPAIASPFFLILSPLLTCFSAIYLFNLYQEIIK